jgi:hypothetical protein
LEAAILRRNEEVGADLARQIGAAGAEAEFVRADLLVTRT